MPIAIDELHESPEQPPQPAAELQRTSEAIEYAARRTLALIALARERDARLAPP